MEHLETDYYGNPDRYRATADGNAEEMFRARLSLLEEFRGGSRLLDIGAGKGEFVATANGAGWNAVGLEPSEGFRQFARGRLNLDLIPEAIDKIQPSFLGTFDVATLNHVLEHVDNPVSFLRHAARTLRPGGVIFIEVPNCDSNLVRLADSYHRIRGRNWSTRLSPLHPPFHRYGFTPRSLRFALDSAGFSISRILTMSGRDRGYRGEASVATVMRTIAASILDRFGNLELLAAIARFSG